MRVEAVLPDLAPQRLAGRSPGIAEEEAGFVEVAQRLRSHDAAAPTLEVRAIDRGALGQPPIMGRRPATEELDPEQPGRRTHDQEHGLVIDRSALRKKAKAPPAPAASAAYVQTAVAP
jgi:hypothetical protein